MSEEERAARLQEMQMNAELHEEQRWKRIKRASERDVQETEQDGGKNFLDATRKSMFGTEKGGSATIEESVRRRTYYLQGGTATDEGNAFRRHWLGINLLLICSWLVLWKKFIPFHIICSPLYVVRSFLFSFSCLDLCFISWYHNFVKV